MTHDPVAAAIASGRAPTMEEVAEVVRPCKFETFSGECLRCGARIGDECEYEREQR